ncbi:MAG: class I SAM-dependent methyltransferase [Anaerolineales bacterium]|nr:class I SAM-dependent methyltransferase [Anaerolineales bacterium]
MSQKDEQETTRQTYDRHAAGIAGRFWDTDLSHIWEAFCGMIPPMSRILDLGCGSGRDAAVFTALGHWVAGMDFSMGMLREAARRAPGNYLQGDMTCLPFAPASFDAAWLNASLLHLPRQLAPGVLAEVREVLKPGGVLYLSLKEGQGEFWEQREGQRFFTLFGVDEVGGLLVEAGFRIEWQWVEPAEKASWINTLALRK